MLVGAGLTVAGLIVSAMLMVAMIGFVLLLGIGLAQAIWVVPAFRHYRSRGEPETAKGILIIAGLVALLNTSCWGVPMLSNFRIQ
jgi:hypothetical protein